MEKFLSCDWGTTTFRLRLIETGNLTTIAEENNSLGIAAAFKLFKQSWKLEKDRLFFYLSIIQKNIGMLEQKSSISLQGFPLVISGMASSTIGMTELAYKELPFFIDGSDLHVKELKASDNFPHDVLIISGCRTGNDVMRGEETQVAGCDPNPAYGEQIFILPGTHSKHITVTKNKVADIKTYMTGEVFDLLSKKSILAASVEEGGDLFDTKNKESFEKGVLDSVRLNLLHSSFLVRTNDLFKKLTKKENYSYLSGLVIGTELKELVKKDPASITLVSNDVLGQNYQVALQVLKINENVKVQDADEATVKGQYRIYQASGQRVRELGIGNLELGQ